MKNPNLIIRSIIILSFVLLAGKLPQDAAIQAKNIEIQESIKRILSAKNFSDNTIEITYTYCTGDLPYPGCSRRYILLLRGTNATYRIYIYDPHQARSFVTYESRYRISDDEFRCLLMAFIETSFFREETEKGKPESIPDSDLRTISITVNGACFKREFHESVDRDYKNSTLRTSKRVKNWQKYDLILEEIDGIPPELNPLESLIDRIIEASPLFMIHKLIDSGDITSVTDLIKKNPLLIDARNDEGDTPLHKFAADSNEKMVELLLDKGAIVDAKDFIYDETPLHLASSKGNLQVVKLLVEKGASVRARNSEGKTPLDFASGRGQIKMVKLLISKGAEIDARDNDNWTPLCSAAYGGCLEVVRLLLSSGADVNVRTRKFGWTPLDKAASVGHKSVTELLLSYGAHINVQDKEGWSPLFMVVLNRHDDLLEYLLSMNADPNIRSTDGRTALHWVQTPTGARILLKYGACINMRDNQGRTPLHYAVKWNTIDLVTIFVEEGADINAVDNEGKTPLKIAIEKDDTKIIDLLRKHGAKE